MKGTLQELIIDKHDCSIYVPPGYGMHDVNYPAVYMNGGDKIPEIISGLESHFGVDCQAFLLICIQPAKWNDDYSPWQMSPLSDKDEPFGGGALLYLNFIIEAVKPYADAHYHTKPEPANTALIGYSLGGLAALYALYNTSTFGKIGSLSGSLWFDGWTEFMEAGMPLNTEAKVYLSLGKGEERSRNQRMGKVGDCTRKAAEILSQQLKPADNLLLEWNTGGHFTEISQRYIKALLWLMKI
jgi:uncharacterized protein